MPPEIYLNAFKNKTMMG